MCVFVVISTLCYLTCPWFFFSLCLAERMVEFTRFTINVGTTLRFDDPRDDPQKCAIRLFIGFDTWALNDNFSKKCGALFLYSRQSGRLIVHHPDARTILELSAGGTEYCSGLRIIIDDFEGHLPLNPTKQGRFKKPESCFPCGVFKAIFI